MPTDFKTEWMEKASIDYFSPFLSLWLACNSWYMSHYADLNDNHPDDKKAPDRDFINKLKSDFSSRNHLYSNFCKLIHQDDKYGIAFRTDIELLHYTLQRVNLKPERLKHCSYNSVVIDYNNNKKTEDLIKKPSIKKDGTPYERDKGKVLKLDKLYISSDLERCFAGIFEIIYQVRNMLVHGHLKPDKDRHDVVKYCYRILWEIMDQS